MKSIFDKFKNSQLEKESIITGGIASHQQERTYVGKNGDTRYTCDTTLNGTVVVGYAT